MLNSDSYYFPLARASNEYASLRSYASNAPNDMNYIAPRVQNAIPMSTVIVPQFSAPGYNALQNGFPNGSGLGGYYTLGMAYPGSATGNCTVYGTRNCY